MNMLPKETQVTRRQTRTIKDLVAKFCQVMVVHRTYVSDISLQISSNAKKSSIRYVEPRLSGLLLSESPD